MAADPLAELLERMKSGATDVSTHANSLKSSLGAVGTAFQSLGKLSSLATAGLSTMTGAIGGLTNAIMSPLDAIKSLAESITSFVSLANPAVVQQFTFALNDAMAVMGGMLTPVLQGMTIYVRAFGDTLARLAPVLQPLFDALAQYLANSAEGFAQIIEAMAPFIQLLTDGLIPIINQVSKAIAFFQGVLIELIHTVAELFGLSSRFDKNKGSQGAALRNIRTTGIDEFARAQFDAMVKNAFGAKGQGKKPEEHLAEIKTAIDQGRAVVQKIVDILTTIWNAIRDYLQKFNEAKKEVMDTGGGIVQGGLLGIGGSAAMKIASSMLD